MNLNNMDKDEKKIILNKLTQKFLRKIRELEASPGKKDNLKKEIRELLVEEKF
jgi:hypothetical protein